MQTLKRINNFKPEFLVNKDERYAKYSKPLSGYVTQKDLDKWKKIGEYFKTHLTKQQILEEVKRLKKEEL